VALNWAVLQLTQSPWHLAVINACRLVPAFVLSVPAGLLADRMDRRALLALLQAGTVVGSLALAWLFAQGAPFAVVAVMVGLRASMLAMEPVARGALLPGLVPPGELTRAIALNGGILTAARFAGPALAAALMVVMAPAGVFMVNAAMAALALVGLAWVHPRPVEAQVPTGRRTVRGDLGEAWGYVRANAYVQGLMVLAIAPMIFGFPYTAMLPMFAEALHGFDATGFAALLSVSAAGAFLATGWLARRAGAFGTRHLVLSVLAFGVCLNAFMLAPGPWMSFVAIFGVGLFGQAYRTLSRSTLQSRVPDRLRGRILAIALMDRGFIPLGVLAVGAAAAWWGPLPAGLAMGTGCVLVTLLVAARLNRPEATGDWTGAPS
jgi:hypothetical protein